MKFKLSVTIAFATLIVALFIKPAKIFGQDAVLAQNTFVMILLAASGVAFFLAYRTRKIDLHRQVSIWVSGMAAVAVVATNMNQLTSIISAPETVVEAAKTEESQKVVAPVRQQPKPANKYDLDLPTVDPVEVFELTEEEKQYALENPEIRDEIPE